MKLFSQVTFSHSLLYYINFSLSCSGFSGDNVGGGYYIFFTLLLENTMHSFTLYTVTGSRILLSSHTVFCPMAIKEQEHCLLLLQLACLHCPRFPKIESFFFFSLSPTTLFTQVATVHELHKIHVRGYFAVQLSGEVTHTPSS